MLLDQVKSECRVRGMTVAEPSALAGLMKWAVEREMSVEAWVAVECACSLGELAEIVQICRQCDAAGLFH